MNYTSVIDIAKQKTRIQNQRHSHQSFNPIRPAREIPTIIDFMNFVFNVFAL